MSGKTIRIVEDGVVLYDVFDELESLKKQLAYAVETEDYRLAIYLRDKIKNFENDQAEIKKIEDELKACVEAQEFEKAIELRNQLRKLKP
jgi:protein-arginine kinase activator protein McsA